MTTIENYGSSPRFYAIKERIVKLLKKADEPMTVRSLVSKLETRDFVWDALEMLQGSGVIKNIGGVMISRWVYVDQGRQRRKMKVCSQCGTKKPLLDFYQEWTGAPSAKCRDCKIQSQKRGKKKVS